MIRREQRNSIGVFAFGKKRWWRRIGGGVQEQVVKKKKRKEVGIFVIDLAIARMRYHKS